MLLARRRSDILFPSTVNEGKYHHGLPRILPPIVAAVTRKRVVIRAGFGIVLALLVLSIHQSYRVQQNESEEAAQIYQRHMEQDNTLYTLRRTVWLASIAARDFLLDTDQDREKRYLSHIAGMRSNADRLQMQLDILAPRTKSGRALRERLRDYWDTLLLLPARASGLDAAKQYEFVQTQIVPRRTAAGDTIREISEVTRQTLQASENEFARNRRHAAQRLFAVLAICGLLGVIVVGLSLRHLESLERKTEAQYQAVERGRAELRQLTTRLMEIQEQERTNLSRELHDEIGQALATLRLELIRAATICREKAPETVDRITRARELAERTVNTVRTMAALLRPSLLDDLGLAPAVRWLAEDFSERTGVPCSISIPEDLPEISGPAATGVFRIFQESLHNCEKHARAHRVDISLQIAGGRLHAHVADDGVGFDAINLPAARSNRRLGILGMRERAAAMNGTLRVESSPGAGTRVLLDVPAALPISAKSDLPIDVAAT